MDRREAIALLRGGPEGIRRWNEKRAAGEGVPGLERSALNGADMRGANLSGMNFLEANLSGAILADTDLTRTDLRHADLRTASLVRANCAGAEMGSAKLHQADLSYANLSRASLNGADCREARMSFVHASQTDLAGANLQRTDLSNALLRKASLRRAEASFVEFTKADLSEADCTEARLAFANLARADLTAAQLSGADLTGSYLSRANLTDAIFHRANLKHASFGYTVIACDLTGALGLEETIHRGQSHVSVAAVFYFKDGQLPVKFLRNCGLRDQEIEYFQRTLAEPQRYYSCFISYSSAEEALVTRLYDDLHAHGIRCWKWDHDAASGKSKWGESDRILHRFDRMLLVASKTSLASEEVNKEIEQALKIEALREQKLRAGEFRGDPRVLITVRADEALQNGTTTRHKAELQRRESVDAASLAGDPGSYPQLLARVIEELKREGEFLA